MSAQDSDFIDLQGTIRLRRGTRNQWLTTNPVLSGGEMGVEVDTHQFKLGDGFSRWNDLPYGGLKGEPGERGEKGELTADLKAASETAVAAANSATRSASEAAQSASTSVQSSSIVSTLAEQVKQDAINAKNSADTADIAASSSTQSAISAEQSATRAKIAADSVGDYGEIIINALEQSADGKVDFWNKGVGFNGGETSLKLSATPLKPQLMTVTFDGVTQQTNAWKLTGDRVEFTNPIPNYVKRIEAQYGIPGSYFTQEVIDAGNASLVNANNARDSAQAAQQAKTDVLNSLNGSVPIGGGLLPNNASTGFLYIPTVDGTPTGIPEVKDGFVPIVFDIQAKRIRFFAGGAWI